MSSENRSRGKEASDDRLFEGADGCIRDISSVHGTYKKVKQTSLAIEYVGEVLQELQVEKVYWYFDTPVSNSGRLKLMLLDMAEQNNWLWEAELVNNPDAVLAEIDGIVVSSDAWILDQCDSWFNLVPYILKIKNIPHLMVKP